MHEGGCEHQPRAGRGPARRRAAGRARGVIRVALGVVLLAVFPAGGAGAGQSSEWLLFIGADGHTAVQYDTMRTGYSSFDRYVPKGTKPEDYLYIFPNEFRLDTTADSRSDIIRFPSGSFALLSEADLEHRKKGPSVTVEPDGTHVLRSWDGRKEANGHFGAWIHPGNFDRYAFAVVLPETFEFVDWQANRDGAWVKRRNTLAFFGKNVNDLVFTVRYRRRSRGEMDAIRTALAGTEGVEVEEAGDAVRVVLADTILFASGSAEIEPGGRAVIARIAQNRRPEARIVVEGHTDDVPIRGALAARFPSNWELSAARALAVVHELSRAGVPEEQLEARAFAATRPRVPNTSAANRARNRRIEILLTRSGGSPATH